MWEYINDVRETKRYRIFRIFLDSVVTPHVSNKTTRHLYLITGNLKLSVNRKMTKFLIWKGADFLRQHYITGLSPAVDIVQCEDQDLVDFFIWRLPNINSPIDAERCTALHYAVRCGNKTTVLKLLRMGANPNQEDLLKNTPVHEAVLSRGYIVLQTLIHYGGDINRLGFGGKSPLHMVAYSPFREITMSAVLQCEPNLELLDMHGNKPLFLFVEDFEDKISEIQMLLESGSNPNAYNDRGMNILHVLASRKRFKISDNLKRIITILIQHGLDVNAQTVQHKNTALHLSIMNENDLVDILLANEASLFVRNAKGQNPFDLVVTKQRLDIIIDHYIPPF